MKANHFCLLILLFLFSNQSFALFQSGFDYKIISGDLKPTPGCKNKKKASTQASTGYRFKKLSKVLCQQIGYGWRLDTVEDKGEVVCEPCENEDASTATYRCYVKNVTLKCGLTRRGW